MAESLPEVFKWEPGITIEQIMERARNDAAAGNPTSDRESLTGCETDFVTQVRNTARDFVKTINESYLGKLHHNLNEIGGALVKLKNQAAQSLGTGNASALNAKIEDALQSDRNELANLRARAMEYQEQWNAFRFDHEINVQASYPDSRLQHMAMVMVAVVAETVMNAFFFENQNGVLGGAVIALAISVLNLGFAALLGHAFTYKNYTLRSKDDSLKQMGYRAFGWISLLVFILLSVYLNGVFSTFRMEYSLVENPDDIAQTSAAFRNALTGAAGIFALSNPFVDVMSFVLFFIGLLICAFSFFKGYTFDDPHPGYGKVDRLLRHARDDYEEAFETVEPKVKRILQERASELEGFQRALADTKGRIESAAIQLRGWRAAYAAEMGNIRDFLRLGISTYRDVNRSIRATPAPAYFSSAPDAELHLTEPDFAQADARLVAELEGVERLEMEWHEKVNSALTDLRNSSAAVSTQAIETFRASVDALASKKKRERSAGGSATAPAGQ